MAALAEGKLVEAGDVDVMADIVGVGAAIERVEVEGILRGLPFSGGAAAGVADRMRPAPLAANGQAFREAALNLSLHRVIVIGTAAGFDVDLGEARTHLENGRADAGGRVLGNSDDAVRPGALEEIAPLAADIGDCQ